MCDPFRYSTAMNAEERNESCLGYRIFTSEGFVVSTFRQTSLDNRNPLVGQDGGTEDE